MEFLIRRRVDGIINMPVDETGAHLKKFQKTGKPIVLIDRKIQGIPCDSVLVDNKKAAEDAMQLFIEKGHKKIGIIGGPEGIFTAEERLEGYYTALKKLEFPQKIHWYIVVTIRSREVSKAWKSLSGRTRI